LIGLFDKVKIRMTKEKVFSNKGQIFSWDLVVSAMIFIVIFLTLVVLLDDKSLAINEEEPKKELEIYTRHAVEALMNTEGFPQDWHELDGINASEISSIGLREGRYGYLDEEKLDKLMKSGEYYDAIKKLLGLTGPNFEFKFNVTIYDTNHIKIDEKNMGYDGDCSKLLILNRLARDYDGRIYKMKFAGCIVK